MTRVNEGSQIYMPTTRLIRKRNDPCQWHDNFRYLISKIVHLLGLCSNIPFSGGFALYRLPGVPPLDPFWAWPRPGTSNPPSPSES